MPKIIHWLDRFNQFTTRAAGLGATLLLAGMLGLMVTHVFFRYVLGDSFGWTEELSRYMMVWMAFLYFPAAHKRGLNVSLEIATRWFKGSAPWRFLQLLIELAIFVMLIWCVKLGLDRIERAGSSVSLSLGISMAKIYWILPVSFALTALSSFERILRLGGSFFYAGLYETEDDLMDTTSRPDVEV